MHSVTKNLLYCISILVATDTIFPGLICNLPVSASIDFKSIIQKHTSKAISEKYGLRSNLLSCLTKLSKPDKVDCQGRDRGCCLLMKLSQQRKKATKKLRKSVTKKLPKRSDIIKGVEKYRNFWDEDQKFDFPRIIKTKHQANKNDIIKRVADGKTDFENLEPHFSFEAHTKTPTLTKK